LQARQGFARLPDGAPILFTGGEFQGRTGKVVHDEGRIVAEVDGRPGLVPVDYTIIEPLNPALSWRTDATQGPLDQQSLLSADLFLPRRKTDESTPFARRDRALQFVRALECCGRAARARGDQASAVIFYTQALNHLRALA
jgi:hypothetical protein